jgi:hypothetical protein
MKHGANGRERPNGRARGAEKAPAQGGERRRPIQAHLKEGIEAALRCEPYFLAVTKTRTALGLVIRELVLEAGRGKVQTIRLMLALLAYEEPEDVEEAQGISDDTVWDWNEDGVWEGKPNSVEEVAEEQSRAREMADMLLAGEHPRDENWARKELHRRLMRVIEAREEEEARQAKLAEEAAAKFPAAGNF